MCRFFYNFCYTISCFVHMVFQCIIQSLLLVESLYATILITLTSCFGLLHSILSLTPLVCFFYTGTKFKCIFANSYNVNSCAFIRNNGCYWTGLAVIIFLVLLFYAQLFHLEELIRVITKQMGYELKKKDTRMLLEGRSSPMFEDVTETMFEIVTDEYTIGTKKRFTTSKIVAVLSQSPTVRALVSIEPETEYDFLSKSVEDDEYGEDTSTEINFSEVNDTGADTVIAESSETVFTVAGTVITASSETVLTDETSISILFDTESTKSTEDVSEVSFEIDTASVT